MDSWSSYPLTTLDIASDMAVTFFFFYLIFIPGKERICLFFSKLVSTLNVILTDIRVWGNPFPPTAN